MKSEEKDVAPDASEYEISQKGTELGATTRPTWPWTSFWGFPGGLSAGGGGAIFKKFLIDDDEKLVEVERRLAFEARHYETLLKQRSRPSR